MGSSGLFSEVFIILIFLIIGLGIIGSAQLLRAVREIALNTRKEDSKEKSTYSALLTVAQIKVILGWIVILGGVVLVYLLSEGGGSDFRRLLF